MISMKGGLPNLATIPIERRDKNWRHFPLHPFSTIPLSLAFNDPNKTD